MAKRIVTPTTAAWGMACWQVSPRVGSAKYNDPCLIGPIAFALDAS